MDRIFFLDFFFFWQFSNTWVPLEEFFFVVCVRYIDGVCVCVTNLIEAKKSLENCESWSWSSMIMIFSQTYTHRERKIQWWQPTKLSITEIIRLWFYKRNVCDWNTIHKQYISIQNRLIIIIGWLFQSKQKKNESKKKMEKNPVYNKVGWKEK